MRGKLEDKKEEEGVSHVCEHKQQCLHCATDGYCEECSFKVERRPNTSKDVIRVVTCCEDESLRNLLKAMLMVEMDMQTDLVEIKTTKASQKVGKHLSLYVNPAANFKSCILQVEALMAKYFNYNNGSLAKARQLEQKFVNVCPKAHRAYQDCISKINNNCFERNAMDDMRLTLEFVLKLALGNNNSIENQLKVPKKGKKKTPLEAYLHQNGRNNEYNHLRNLLDKYTWYQNGHIKHNYEFPACAINVVLYATNLLIDKFLIGVNANNASFPDCRDVQNCKGCKK